ncbi:unnamed protein product [Urochloa humidicola]
MSSSTNILIANLSRHRSSPPPSSTSPSEPQQRPGPGEAEAQQRHACVAQPSDPHGATAVGSAEASSNGGGSLGCDGTPVSSPQMSRSTTPTLGTIMAFSDDNHNGDGEDIMVPVEFDGEHEPPVFETAAADEHEQDRHDDNPDPVGALADELEDGARYTYTFLVLVLNAEHDGDDDPEFSDDQWSDDPEQMVRRQIHDVMNWHLLAQALGTDIQTIIAHVQEEEGADGGGFGAVPASATAMACLEKRTFHATNTTMEGCCGGGGMDECAICFEEFEDGEEVSMMPCSHRHEFHVKCITKWLGRSNTCPLCRHQLPTAGVDCQ